jgi:hypothetical protein
MYGLFVITYFMYRDRVIREKPVEIRTMSTGWLALWLERLTPDQEDMSSVTVSDRSGILSGQIQGHIFI